MKASPTRPAVSSVKSGKENKAYAKGCIGSFPKKNVDDIYSQCMVKTAPGSVAKKSGSYSMDY